MSEKSHWLLIGGVAATVFLTLGMAPAAVSVSGPSLLVVIALAWIVSRAARDGRALVDRARPALRQMSAALEDEPSVKGGLRCSNCDARLPVGAVYCVGCGKRLPVIGKTEALR